MFLYFRTYEQEENTVLDSYFSDIKVFCYIGQLLALSLLGGFGNTRRLLLGVYCGGVTLKIKFHSFQQQSPTVGQKIRIMCVAVSNLFCTK